MKAYRQYHRGAEGTKRDRGVVHVLLMALVINVFSPNRSSEPKHILFYYRADCLSLERRHSELRQVTKTNKIPTRKYLQFLPAEVINPKRGLSFMNQKR